MKVSIIITAYNVEKYIKDAIDSCINQTYKDLEIVIVEDCSTDSTKRIIEQYNDPRIKIIQHEKNLGCGLAKRSGIEAVTGEYFILLDADDWLDIHFIEHAVKNALQTGADIIMGEYVKYNSDSEPTIIRIQPEILIGNDKLLKQQVHVTANNKLIRTELRDKICWSERRYIEDTQTLLPILYYANKVSCIDKLCFHYRYNENSLINKSSELETCIYQSLCYADAICFLLSHWETIPVTSYTIGLFLQSIRYIKFNRLTNPDSLIPYYKEIDELEILTYKITSRLINLIK